MDEFDVIKSELRPGLSVIEASAGTGKTHALSHLVPRLLLDGSVDSIGKILLVTFTNDAARELSDRVRKVLETLHAPAAADENDSIRGIREEFAEALGKGIVARALLDIDQLRVSTIHSFCQQVLQTEGALCGLPAMPELLADTDEIIGETLHDLWESDVAGNPLASALVVAQGWKFEDDLRFVKRFLPDHAAEVFPAAGDFEADLRRLDALPSSFDAAVCGEIRSIVDSVAGWLSNKDPSQTGILEHIDRLEQAADAAAPGFLSALKPVADLPGCIKKAKQVDLIARASNSAAVQFAQAAADLAKNLRWSFRIRCLRLAHDAVEDTLKTGRQISYDGLIGHLHRALNEGVNKDQLVGRLRERYAVALIDESQDTDPRQFGIFSTIFLGGGRHRMVLIGDPKQAIYGFRGADVNTYLDAAAAAGHVFGRNKTFRSPQALVDAWNVLFARPGALLKDGLECRRAVSGLDHDTLLSIDGNEQESRMEFWIAPDGDSKLYSAKPNRNRLIAAQTASEIVRLLNSGKLVRRDGNGGPRVVEDVRPNHIAVLVGDRRQAEAVEEALKERSVPSVRAGVEDIMASEEAADLLAILAALDDPRRRGLRFAALATRLLGRDDAQLRGLSDSEDAMLGEFLRWEEEFLRHGPAAAIALIDREQGVVASLANGDDGDRRVTNFRQLCDVLQAAHAEHGNRAGRFVRWFGGEIARAQERTEIEERQIQLESDAEAVRIVTMHKAKGLEFDLVFCPFLWDSRVPKGPQKLSRRGERDVLVDIELSDAKDSALARAALEELLRLAYVAITRAKVRVWIHAGEVCGANTVASALDWLLRTEHPDGAALPLSGPDFDAWRAVAESSGRGVRHDAGIKRLMDAAGGVISRKAPPAPANVGWRRPAANHGGLLPPEPAPHVPEPWYLTSFSALTREENPRWDSGAGIPAERNDSPPADTDIPPNPFLLAVGGRVVGDAVHGWLEQWDFAEPDADAVKRHFDGYTLPEPKASDPAPPPFDTSAAGMLRELRKAVLPGFGCSIAAACPDPRASEWHFHLPIRDDAPLDAASIARAFEQYPQKGYEGYHERLADLNADNLRGFLHGFIDRLAIDPRTKNWGVIDWKTNKLGDSASAYSPASLRACVMDRHYFLQVHLYLVALRRYLRKSLPAEDAWLVFLRGVSAGTSHGTLHIKPPGALLAALDKLFFAP